MFVICTTASAIDETPKGETFENRIEAARQEGHTVNSISPIYSQLVLLPFPSGFKIAFEDVKGNYYIRELVLTGENTDNWSQMVTVTGSKGLASNPNVTPQSFVNGKAGVFKNACPTSFSGTGLGAFKIGGYAAFAAVLSCGATDHARNLRSESTLMIAIKGVSDYYTVQWAERAGASMTPIAFDKAKWSDRFRKLMPIKLCPIVPGEPAPYPSCSGGT